MINDPAFDVLSAEEQQVVQELLGPAIVTEIAPQNRVVPIEEWLESEYYVGTLKHDLYPFWKEQMIEVFRDGFKPRFTELVITGSLSTGKSFFSRMVWLRLCYIFSQFPDVAIALGHASKNKIFMAYLSVSEKEAELTGFGEFRTMIDNIPYFQDNYKRNPEKKSMLEFPNGLNVIAGSDVLHFIGQNLVSLIFDEANFTRRGGGRPGDIEKALEIYQNSHLRIKTRFAHARSILPGMNIMVSSATHRSSFTEQTIEAVAADKTTKIIQASVYETMPKGSYSEERFVFYCGNDLCDPRIIEGRADLVGIMTENERLTLPEVVEDAKSFKALLPGSVQLLVELVPVDFYEECKRMPEQALRDIIGHSQAAKNSFFKDHVSFKACEDAGQTCGLRHPFTSPIISIGVKDPAKVEDYLDVDVLKAIVGEKPVFIHLDQSVTGDSTGIAGSFPFEIEDKGWFVALAFMLRIDPPGGGDEISIEKCRRFVTYLRSKFINVAQVSYDQYQSRSSLQLLSSEGVETRNLSLDTDDSPWMDVANLMYQRRLWLYHYKPFKDEWFTLVHDRVAHKVDHPPKASKDVADAVTGSVWSAWMSVAAKEAGSEKANKVASMLAVMSAVVEGDQPDVMKSFFGDTRMLHR